MTAAAVAWRVVEDEQEDTVEDEEVVREEDLSDEEADSAGPVKWVVPAWKWEVLANGRAGVERRAEEFESERVRVGRSRGVDGMFQGTAERQCY
jgi:hypothetical protein